MQGPTAARIRSGRAPSRAIACTVASSTPASAPRQPAWAAPITRAVGIGEQDRRAVGAQHAERDARAIADQRVGLPAAGGRARAHARPRPRRRGPGGPCTGCPRARPSRAERERPVALDHAPASSPPDQPQFSEHEDAPADPARAGRRSRGGRRPRAPRFGGLEHGVPVRPASGSAQEARRQRAVRAGEHEHLEQLAHGGRIDQPREAGAQLRGAGPGAPARAAAALAPRSRRRAGTCPGAPGRRPRHRPRAAALRQRPEVDLGREIDLARCGQRIGARVAADRLQGVAGRAARQRRRSRSERDPARGRDPLADLAREPVARRAELGDACRARRPAAIRRAAMAGRPARSRGCRPRRARPGARPSPARSGTSWWTGRASKNSLATRNSGPSGTSSRRSCQAERRGRAEALRLELAQPRAGLDQMDRHRLAKARRPVPSRAAGPPSACRGRGRARPGRPAPAGRIAPRPRRATGRRSRRTSG